MYKVLFLISLCIIIVLVKLILSTHKKLKYIKIALDDVISGNTNRRIMLNNNLKIIAEVVNNTNLLIENTCKMDNEKNRKTMMMRKMISNISHDFKTPLTSMLGYIELMKENEDLDMNEVKENLNIIYNKANFLNVTLDNFFYLSRLESEDEKLNIEIINLTEIVQEQIIFFYEDFKKIGTIPEINMTEDDVFVFADKISVNRILNNLISNSLKYGKDGNKVGVKVKDEIDNISVEVWDNGKGISSKDLPLIFERLYTVEDSRNVNLTGNGIGLSIVKKLVKSNNGTMSVSSIPFEKTSFTFKLPKVKPIFGE